MYERVFVGGMKTHHLSLEPEKTANVSRRAWNQRSLGSPHMAPTQGSPPATASR